MSESKDKVWFITGSSTGFGRELAEEALEQGYRVVATARKPEVLDDLVKKYPETAAALLLDVTEPAGVRAAVNDALAKFGKIDVLVNNAGYGLIGALEEVSDEQIRQQFDTNVFGALDVMRAVLPHMREQGSGHILNLSSVGGFVAFPSAGLYTASKFALEAFSEALSKEAGHLGIKVTIVEPGAFRTSFNGAALTQPANPMPEVYPSTTQFGEWLATNDGKQPGDPRKAAQAMIKAVESENPPLRLALGGDAIQAIEAKLKSVKTELDAWQQVGMDTTFPGLKAEAIGG